MRRLGSVFGKFSPTQIAKSLSQTYSQLRQNVKGEIGIVNVTEGLFQIDYPRTNNVSWLQSHIDGRDYMVWNLSQYQYEDNFPQKLLEVSKRGQIHRLCFQYYSGPPFFELLSAIDSIAAFLREKPSGKVYVHCQQGKMRSAVFLSCYLIKTGKVGCIGEAVTLVNRLLRVNLEEGCRSQASHHMLIKNFLNYLTDPRFINSFTLQLTTLSALNLPNIRCSEGNEFVCSKVKVFLQVWHQQKLVFKGYGKREKDDLVWLLNVVVSDQFLVIVKYILENQAYRVLRLQLNTNFILEQRLKVEHHNIDFSSNVLPLKGNTCIYLSFKQLSQNSRLAQLSNKQQSQIDTDLLELSKVKEKEVVPQSNFDLKGEGLQQGEVNLSDKIDELIRSMAERQQKQKAEVEQYIDSEQQESLQEVVEQKVQQQLIIQRVQKNQRAFEQVDREEPNQYQQREQIDRHQEQDLEEYMRRLQSQVQ